MENEYYALVTIELSSKDEDKRNNFNKLLQKWHYKNLIK